MDDFNLVIQQTEQGIEKQKNCSIHWLMNNNILDSFSFDRIYEQESTQEEIYTDSCLELVDAAIQGFDVTILTYGQTGMNVENCFIFPGSGKTHTILGEVGDIKKGGIVTQQSGMFLRILTDLFQFKQKTASVTVAIRGMQILTFNMFSFHFGNLFGKFSRFACQRYG